MHKSAFLRQFGRRLEALRAEKQLTQVALAAAVGVHQTSVSAWEAGRQAPDAWLLRRICEALGVRADELLGLRASRAPTR